MRTVRFMCDDCDLERVIAHFRRMAHRRKWNGEPENIRFWNDRTRAVIAAWRQQSSVERMAA